MPLRLPSRSRRSSRLIRRATDSAMPTASSATALALAPGVLITAIAARPRRIQVDVIDADAMLADHLQLAPLPAGPP